MACPNRKIHKDYRFRVLSAGVNAASDDKNIRITGIATKEGVWNQIYRPAALVERAHKSLLGRPIIVNHPVGFEGTPYSDIVITYPSISIGQIDHVEYRPEGGEIYYEGYLEPGKTPAFIADRIAKGLPLDNSVGFFSDVLNKPGVFGDKPFSGEEQELVLDHLALVPVGACTWADGCGAGQNAADMVTIENILAIPPENLDKITLKQFFDSIMEALCGRIETKTAREDIFNYAVKVLLINAKNNAFKINTEDLNGLEKEKYLEVWNKAFWDKNSSPPEIVDASQKDKTAPDNNLYIKDTKKGINQVEDTMPGTVNPAPAGGATSLKLATPQDLEAAIAEAQALPTPEEKISKLLLIVNALLASWKGQSAQPNAAAAGQPGTNAAFGAAPETAGAAGAQVITDPKNAAAPAATTIPMPVLAGDEKTGFSITWGEAKSPADVQKAVDDMFKNLNGLRQKDIQTINDLQQKISATDEQIKTELVGQIKTLNPALTEEELAFYKGQPIDTLKTMVLHLGKIKPATPGGFPGVNAAAGQTQFDIQAGAHSKEKSFEEIDTEFNRRTKGARRTAALAKK